MRTDNGRSARAVGSYLVVPTVGAAEDCGRYILDTNVLIDFEKFFFGSLGIAGRSDVLRLLWELSRLRKDGRPPDVNWGFGLSEMGSPRRTTPDLAWYRRTAHAVACVVEWDRDDVCRAADSLRSPAATLGLPIRAAHDVELPDHEGVDTVLTASYAALLYGAWLLVQAPRLSVGAAEAYEEYVRWTFEELDLVGVYEMAIISRALVGTTEERQMARSFLKFSGDAKRPDELADRAWNAAWDIWLMRATEGNTFGMAAIPGPAVPTALVTRDRWAPWLRDLGSVRAAVQRGSRGTDDLVVEFGFTGNPDLSRRANEAIDRAHGRFGDASRMAKRMLRPADPDGIREAARRLEERVGVQSSRLAAFD